MKRLVEPVVAFWLGAWAAAGGVELPKAADGTAGGEAGAGLIPGPNLPPQTPKNFAGEVLPDLTVKLSWEPNRELDLKGYLLYRSVVPGVQTLPAFQVAEIPKTDSTRLDIQLQTSLFYKLVAIDLAGLRSEPTPELALVPTAVEEKRRDARPARFELFQNYPNPFNSSTTLEFALSAGLREAPGELAVYNLVGRTVRVLASGSFKAGRHAFVWDGRDQSGRVLPSGVYFFSLTIGPERQVKKMVLLK